MMWPQPRIPMTWRPPFHGVAPAGIALVQHTWLTPPPWCAHTAAGVVGELDPDAPGRQGRGLQPDNARAEERLLGRLWQLVRAGRLQDARALCQACGQPWRAASLAGAAGDWGPLPVGLAAGRLEEELEDGVQVGYWTCVCGEGGGTGA